MVRFLIDFLHEKSTINRLKKRTIFTTTKSDYYGVIFLYKSKLNDFSLAKFDNV